MNANLPSITYIGGPTALLEWHGLRLLTDPTFDPAGTVYELPEYSLRKTKGPVVPDNGVSPFDVVLLSHDHHFDNLDWAGRALLPRARWVLTTSDGAQRLGRRARGLAAWESLSLPAPDGTELRVTAAPARHGPPAGDRGPVIGFIVSDDRAGAVYFSGDTVLYDGVREVAARVDVAIALLCVGAARIAAAGGEPLTLTARDAVEVARAMPAAQIVPLHFEGWEHLSESREDVEREFAAAGLAGRLRWPGGGP